MRIRVLGHYVRVQIAALALAEAVISFGMLLAAVFLRFPEDFPDIAQVEGALWPRAVLFSAAMTLSLLAFGLYSSRQRAQAAGLIIRLVAAVLVGAAIASLFFYVLYGSLLGRGALALAGVGALLGLAVSRGVFTYVVDESLFKRRVLVYGAGNHAAAISKLRRRSDRRGFNLVGFVKAPTEADVVPDALTLTAPDGLLALCRAQHVDEVVVAMDERRRGFPILELLECRLGGIDVAELLTFLERETGRIRIDVMNPSWMIFGEGFRRGSIRRVTSRCMDLAASALILLVTLPLTIITALAIKTEDGIRAPVFYRQSRVGLAGKRFSVYKFRSMRLDAERDGARWASKNDSRVTRVGAFIRKTRVDELPQIWCVLRGHMSFVGPRPERPEFVVDLQEKIPYYAQRHCVKPGITGWAQLCYPYGSSEQDALEKLQYDLYYIKNNSLLFDIAILLQTVEVVFMGQGAR